MVAQKAKVVVKAVEAQKVEESPLGVVRANT
jgi:hypothetical protein